MANPEHLEILKQGFEKWNEWRENNPEIKPNLFKANLHWANLRETDLSGADLRSANLGVADLFGANLSEADLRDAVLLAVNLSETELSNTNLSGALIGSTIFADVDLSTVIGIETITHHGASTIGIDTLINSKGKIPEVFLRGCGVPENLITFLPSLIGQAFEFYSCFISYSHQDKSFA